MFLLRIWHELTGGHVYKRKAVNLIKEDHYIMHIPQKVCKCGDIAPL